MKLIRKLIALAAIAASAQVMAETFDDYDVRTTESLIELCGVSVGDPAYEAAMGFCLGYIDAALDYHAALTAGSKSDAIACPDNTVSREQIVVVVVDWSRRNTQHLKSEVPVHGVMRAIVEKWPCSGQ